MTNRIGQRNTGIELLRLISMFLIVMHHYSSPGSGFPGLLFLPDTFNKFFVEFMYFGGKIGVNCFVIISGYFLSGTEFKISRLIKLWLLTVFYSVLIYVVFSLFRQEPFSGKELIKSAFPILTNRYWFITAYVALYLLYPFINRMIDNLEHKQMLTLLAVLSVGLCIIPTFLNKKLWTSDLIWFVYMYILGASIRRNILFHDISRKKLLGILLVSTLLMWCSEFVLTKLCEKKGIVSIDIVCHFIWEYSILTVAASIALFKLCEEAKIAENMLAVKWITRLSRSAFAVYLIHANVIVRDWLWLDLFKNMDHINDRLLPLRSIIIVVAVFTGCLLIDQLRIYIAEHFMIIKYKQFLKKADAALEKYIY